MNKEIIKKIIKIEKLKYEIIKGMLPAKVLSRVNKFENEAAIVIKDIVLDIINEPTEKGEEETKKEVKKVKVNFL